MNGQPDEADGPPPGPTRGMATSLTSVTVPMTHALASSPTEIVAAASPSADIAPTLLPYVEVPNAEAGEPIRFRGRTFKSAGEGEQISSAPQPQPPAEARYASRVSRARVANRATVMSRSASATELGGGENAALPVAKPSAPVGDADAQFEGGAGDDAPQQSVLPVNERHTLQQAGQRSRAEQVALAMLAEVDRPDCREMVRDGERGAGFESPPPTLPAASTPLPAARRPRQPPCLPQPLPLLMPPPPNKTQG